MESGDAAKKRDWVLVKRESGEELYRNKDLMEVIREGKKYRDSETEIEIDFDSGKC